MDKKEESAPKKEGEADATLDLSGNTGVGGGGAADGGGLPVPGGKKG